MTVATDAVATALNAAITAKLPAGGLAYDYDDLPATRPKRYVETGLSRIPDYDGTASMRRNPPRFRFTARVVTATVGDARVFTDRVRLALEGARIAVGDRLTGPIRFETEDPMTYDASAYTGLTSWYFHLEETP